MASRSLQQETQFVENFKAKQKALGRPVTDQQARSAFQKALKQKAAGGADVNVKVRKGVLSRQRRRAK